MTQHAKMVGADGALIVLPYYNRPSQAGLTAHIERLNEVELPLVIYNIPSRTGINMEPPTFEKLSHLEYVVGVKEASGSINQISDVIIATKGRCSVMSGDDALTLPLLSVGGTGVISVIANLVPREMSRLVEAWEEGRSYKHETDIQQMLIRQYLGGGSEQSMLFDEAYIDLRAHRLGADVVELWQALKGSARKQGRES